MSICWVEITPDITVCYGWAVIKLCWLLPSPYAAGSNSTTQYSATNIWFQYYTRKLVFCRIYWYFIFSISFSDHRGLNLCVVLLQPQWNQWLHPKKNERKKETVKFVAARRFNFPLHGCASATQTSHHPTSHHWAPVGADNQVTLAAGPLSAVVVMTHWLPPLLPYVVVSDSKASLE